MTKINFHIPGLYTHYKTNIKLIKLFNEHSEYFYNNINIAGVYGVFPPNLWNGGRAFTGYVSKELKEYIVNTLNQYNVSVLYTFTNTQLEERMFNDFYGNEDMQIANNGMNKVIVNDEKLINYIQEKYPKYKFVSSITKTDSKKIESIEEKSLQDKYYACVINHKFNNTDILFNIKHKEKIEIILNTQCINDCPYEKNHYDIISKLQLGIDIKNFECPTKNSQLHTIEELIKLPSFITVDDLYNKYVPSGFNIFKINGRARSKEDIISYYLYYLVKSEYQEIVKEILSQED